MQARGTTELEEDGKGEQELRVSWHALPAENVLELLHSPLERGLTSQEAQQRLERFGPNQLQEKAPPTFFQLVLEQLNNFVVILLIVAAVVSGILGEFIDAGAILVIVILNTVLGVIQESRAEHAIAALKKMAAPEAHVLRDGKRTMVPAGELVPGDIVYLEAGSYVPADLRLLEAINLRVDEAALTGESVAAGKNAAAVLDEDASLGDRSNTAFMGTTVTYGRGTGVVVATGMRTQLGLIANMIQSVEEEKTPLQQNLDNLGRMLGWGTLGICVVVFGVSVMRTSGAIADIVNTFMIAVSLAVAAVPEGLPAVVTISLAIGMTEMVKRHVLVRKLAAVETLGSTTVICSDKTGTLTLNSMTVTRLWTDGLTFSVTGSGSDPQGEFQLDGKAADLNTQPAARLVLGLGVLNNDAELEPLESENGHQAYRIIGDPTEGCLLIAALKGGVLVDEVSQSYPRSQEIPFDSDRKRMLTLHALPETLLENPALRTATNGAAPYLVAVKGAPDVVLGLCSAYLTKDGSVHPLDEEARQRIAQANDAMTREALRMLGFAYRMAGEPPEAEHLVDLEQDLIFAGLMGMIDPPRPEVRTAMEHARAAGIRTLMITGDYPNTARAIAESIGLLRKGHRVLTGAELNALDDAALRKEVEQADVYARVSPEHKVRIVDALKNNNEVVAMTGDGVNDAPSLKRSDIGIAMGITGTDVTKETADMILTDDNYASIVSAVEQGRVIYSNIRKFVYFLISSNIAEILVIFLASLGGLPTPLVPIQLLWLNLLTDGAPALALAMEKGEPDIMNRPPRPKKEPIINGPIRTGIVIQGIAQTAAVLGAFVLGLTWHLSSQVPAGTSPFLYLFQYDWRGVDVQTAETMAFVTLSLCELFRAYTVRSERSSLFTIGVFSNRWMQYAAGASVVLLIAVCVVPFLQPVFNTHLLAGREWLVAVGFALIPAVIEEIYKAILRSSDRRHQPAEA
jgi:Ca2+-transporting ATPase